MGFPGVPSSSTEDMPDDVVLCGPAGRRARREPTPLGRVLASCGDWVGRGGEKGRGIVEKILAELARRARSFSARSARKKISSGDSCREGSVVKTRCWGVGASVSVGGGEGSWFSLESFIPGESSALAARKLGIGREDGAGEAWNVAPANAATAADLGTVTDCGGVVRPYLVSSGEVDACFCFCLFAVRGFDLGLVDCDAGPGLFLVCLWGVNGSGETRSSAKA